MSNKITSKQVYELMSKLDVYGGRSARYIYALGSGDTSCHKKLTRRVVDLFYHKYTRRLKGGDPPEGRVIEQKYRQVLSPNHINKIIGTNSEQLEFNNVIDISDCINDNLYQEESNSNYINYTISTVKGRLKVCSEIDLYNSNTGIEVKTGKNHKTDTKFALQWMYFCGIEKVYLLQKCDEFDNPILTFIPKDLEIQKAFNKGMKILHGLIYAEIYGRLKRRLSK